MLWRVYDRVLSINIYLYLPTYIYLFFSCSITHSLSLLHSHLHGGNVSNFDFVAFIDIKIEIETFLTVSQYTLAPLSLSLFPISVSLAHSLRCIHYSFSLSRCRSVFFILPSPPPTATFFCLSRWGKFQFSRFVFHALIAFQTQIWAQLPRPTCLYATPGRNVIAFHYANSPSPLPLHAAPQMVLGCRANRIPKIKITKFHNRHRCVWVYGNSGNFTHLKFELFSTRFL